MEQHNQEIGTRRDLVLYRLETARNDLKSARALFSIENCASHSRYFSLQIKVNTKLKKVKKLYRLKIRH